MTEYNELLVFLNDYYSIFYSVNPKYDKSIDMDEVRKQVITFYNNYFNIHNIYYYPKRMKILKNSINKQAIEILNLEKINPFDIPITISKKLGCFTETRNISLTSYSVNTKNNQVQLLEENINLIHKIVMDRTCISKESYAHEITHTQCIMPKDSLYYLNDEVLPIFVELVCGEYFNSNNMLYSRINDLYFNIKINNICKNKIEILKYIKSTLKAFNLYYLFINESLSSSRNRVIDDVNSVFDNNISLNELLKKYNINDDNYMNKEIIKSIIKR